MFAEIAIQHDDPLYLDLIERISRLEADSAQKDRTIVGLQNELIRAGRYTNIDPQKQLEGVQVLLTKAGEYKGRKGRRR